MEIKKIMHRLWSDAEAYVFSYLFHIYLKLPVELEHEIGFNLPSLIFSPIRAFQPVTHVSFVRHI